MTKSAFMHQGLEIFYEMSRDSAGQCIADYNRSYGNSRLHFHRAFELICVMEGELNVLTVDGTLTLQAGSAAVFEELCLHGTRKSENGSFMTILITERYLDAFRRLRGDRRLASNICLCDEAGIIFAAAKALNRMNQPFRTDAETDAYRQSVIDILMLTVARQVGFVGKPITTAQRMLPVIAYVMDHLEENLTIREIAPKFGYTPRMLTKHFSEYAGISLKEFIIAGKISVAKQLLQSGASLEEAAVRGGFGCIRTFHRVFLEQVGVTPGDYRANIRRAKGEG